MNVRALARRRQSTRLRHAAASRLAALSREIDVPVDVLRTLAGISDPRNAHRLTRAAFHARGERAWQQYLRDGVARPFDEVFDDLEARVSTRRATLAALRDAKAGKATRTALDRL